MKKYPISTPQKSIWYTKKTFKDIPIANVGGVFEIDVDEFHPDIWEQSINLLIENHDGMRIRTIDGNPASQYIEEFKKEKFEILDLSNLSLVERDALYQKWMQEILNGKLHKYKIIKASESQVEIFFGKDHIITDGYSEGLALQEIGSAYFDLLKLKKAELKLNNIIGMIKKIHRNDFKTKIKIGLITYCVPDFIKINNQTKSPASLYLTALAERNHLKKQLRQEKPSYLSFLKRDEEYLKGVNGNYAVDQEYFKKEFEEEPNLVSLSPKQTMDPSASRYTKIIDKELTEQIQNFCSKAPANFSVSNFFETIILAYMKIMTGEDRITIGTALLNRTNRKGLKEREIIGMFINTLPLTVKIPNNIDINSFSKIISKKKGELFRHQQFPYFDIYQDLKNRFDYSGKLFDVVFSYQNASIFKKGKQKNSARTREIFNGYSPFGLSINFNDRDEQGEYVVNMDYQKGAYSKKDVESHFERMLFIAQQVMKNPDITLNELEILTEKDKADYEKINGKPNLPIKGNVVDNFEKQVKLNPNQPALYFDGKYLTYENLNNYVNSLAHTIISYNLPKGSTIPIVGERHGWVIIAQLAVAKAGHTPFIVDYEKNPKERKFPDSRWDEVLDECNAKFMLKHNDCTYSKSGVAELNLDTNEAWSGNFENPNIPIPLNAGFYTMQTSATTGPPKCIENHHAGMVNLCVNNNKLIGNSKHGINLSSMSFDAFTYINFMALLNGRAIVLTTPEEHKNVNLTEEVVGRFPDSFTLLTPRQILMYLRNSQSNAWQNINHIAIGGAAWNEYHLKLVRDKTGAIVWNLYGPAEASVACSGDLITDDNITMGGPLSNYKLYVVDPKTIRILPPGVPGELVIIGTGLGDYVNNPELSREKFIILPETGERAYKSGDLVYIDNNLKFNYLARIDKQVKKHGLRIETEEIESNILNFEGIMQSAVVLKKHEVLLKKTDLRIETEEYLVGYYVSNKEIDEEKLRTYLATKTTLPYYMVPNFFVKVSEIPLKGDKIDEKKLPIPDFEAILKANYVAPENDIQRAICDIWEQILNKSPIGINSPFLFIGGDSPEWAEVESMVEKAFNIKIRPGDLPDNPTIKMIESVVKGEPLENKFDIPENLDLEGINIAPLKTHGDVLLTGVTGWLGSHILWQLLNTTSKKIYCLVRDEEKFDKLINSYFLKDGNSIEPFYNRVYLIKGDVTKDKLGMNLENYAFLQENISDFINCAAKVNHYGSLEESKAVNVTGTENSLKFCGPKGIKYHHTCTLTVSGDGLTRQQGNRKFTERDLNIGQAYKDNVYVWTKYIAAQYVNQFQKMGGSASIYRYGSITERSYDGLFQINEEESGIKAIMGVIKHLGIVPQELLNKDLQSMEVDKCAEATVTLMNGNFGNRTYHIYDPNKGKLEYFLKNAGIEYQITDIVTFANKVAEAAKTNRSFLIVKKYLADFTENPYIIENCNTETDQILQTAGFQYSSNKSHVKVKQQ